MPLIVNKKITSPSSTKLPNAKTQIAEKKGWGEYLKDAVYAVYEGIIDTAKNNPITNLIKNPFAGLWDRLNAKTNPDRAKIDALRAKHFDLIAKESAKANPDYNAVTKKITTDIKQFINGVIAEEIKKLGTPPCKIQFATLGSMAREETGPITDFELLLLVDKKTVDSCKYTYELTQRIADRLFLLGEHPDIGGKGLRMDEADNAPPHLRFFARHATPEEAQKLVNDAILNKEWDKIPYEGSRPFLATPEEFASFTDPNFKQDKTALRKERHKQFEMELSKALKNPKNAKKAKSEQGRKEIENEIHFWLNRIYQPFSTREMKIAEAGGRKLGRNMAPLYGSEDLFQRFKEKRETILQSKRADGTTERQYVALTKMREDVQDILLKGKSIYLTGQLGKTLDFKRELYRFTEQLVTNLGFYHKCKSQNGIEIINELMQRKIMGQEFGLKLINFIQFINGLRLKEQTILKRQGFACYFDQAEFNEDKTDLEKQINNMEAALHYMESTPQINKDALAAKKRELIKLKDKLHHLLDMAPGKIYSPEDVNGLKGWLPFAKEIFRQSQLWTQENAQTIGFDYQPPVSPKAAAPVPGQGIMQQVMAAIGSPSGGILNAYNKLFKKKPDIDKKAAVAHKAKALLKP